MLLLPVQVFSFINVQISSIKSENYSIWKSLLLNEPNYWRAIVVDLIKKSSASVSNSFFFKIFLTPIISQVIRKGKFLLNFHNELLVKKYSRRSFKRRCIKLKAVTAAFFSSISRYGMKWICLETKARIFCEGLLMKNVLWTSREVERWKYKSSFYEKNWEQTNRMKILNISYVFCEQPPT